MSENVSLIGGVILIAMNLGALVWGASAIRSAVRSLEVAVGKLSAAVEKLDDRVDAHDVAIAILRQGKAS